MRVIQVISNLNVGGTETQLVSLAEHIDRQRYEMLVCCIGSGVLVANLKRIGVEVFVLNKKPGELGILPSYRMYKLFQKYRPQIVHCQGFAAGRRGHMLAKLAGVPVVIKSYHGLNLWKKGTLLWMDRLLSRSTDKYVVVSNARRVLLTERERIPDHKTMVIHNGIDYERFDLNLSHSDRQKKRAKMGLNPSKFCVGTVGSLTEVKNQKLFLETAKLVRVRYANVQFVIVGDGPQKGYLETYCKELGIGNDVHFLGLRQDIPEILQILDVFIMSSLREDLSMAILEAMTARLPVIATRVGGNSELVIQGQTGFLVGSGDSRAMASRIIELLNDKNRKIKMGDSGRQHIVEHFSSEANARKFESLYDLCLRTKGFGL